MTTKQSDCAFRNSRYVRPLFQINKASRPASVTNPANNLSKNCPFTASSDSSA